MDMKNLNIVVSSCSDIVFRTFMQKCIIIEKSENIESQFPWSTLAVNLIGCLIIGVLLGLQNHYL